jgi:hypothetical protein
VAIGSDVGSTTEELLNAWRKAESAMNETVEGSLARMFTAHRTDEAREAYQARIGARANLKLDELAKKKPRGR